METRFLRSESPPEGQAKYWNNIPPTMGKIGSPKQNDQRDANMSENICAQTRLCPVVKLISRLRDKEGPSAYIHHRVGN